MIPLRNARIAVLMGGPGSERKVSLASGEGVCNALRFLGAEPIPVDVTGPDFSLPEDITIAFNVIHGTFGEDGQLQRILEAKGIPYTGEGVAGSELAIDKIRTKLRFAERGIPTAPFEVLRPGVPPSLPLPLVLKAPREGSTVGIFIVKTPDELPHALKAVSEFGDQILAEAFVHGRELTVGILGAQALPIIEIRPKDGFYNFDNKYPFLNPAAGGGADHFCPAPLAPETAHEVSRIALEAHRALDLQVYSRVDFLLPADGTPIVLEINTIPGMTPASLLPEAAAVAGIPYADLCARIIALSLETRAAR